MLRGLAWRMFSAVRAKSINRGFRKRACGKFVFAGINRACQLGLRAVRPFMPESMEVHGNKMYLAGWEKSALPFTAKVLFDRFEEGTTSLLEKYIRPGMSVVDAGAHFGYFTLLASKLVGPTGKVYAFEPDETSFALLEKNIRLNNCLNVLSARKAVFSQSGTLTLYHNPLGSEGHSVYAANAGDNGKGCEVEATSLDDFLESQGSPHVDLIKMDVEGAELECLKGMSRAIRSSSVQSLIVEFCPILLEGGRTGAIEFLDALAEFGFSISTIDENGAVLRLGRDDYPHLLERLEKETLVNLFCQTKKPATEVSTRVSSNT